MPAFMEFLVVPAILFMVIVAPLWLIFHYVTVWKTQRGAGRVDDALSRFEALHRRIDELEGRAEVFDMGKGGQGKSLEQEFATLEAESGLDAELDALKQRLNK